VNFLPNAVLCSAGSINTPRLAYGQNAVFWDLPVKGSARLRANRRFLGFTRKRQHPLTGKTAFSGICP